MSGDGLVTCVDGSRYHTFVATPARGQLECRDCKLSLTIEDEDAFLEAVRRTWAQTASAKDDG